MRSTIERLNISTRNPGSKRLETTRETSTFTGLSLGRYESPVLGIKAQLGRKKAFNPNSLSAQEVIAIKIGKILVKMAEKIYKLEKSKTFWTSWMKKI